MPWSPRWLPFWRIPLDRETVRQYRVAFEHYMLARARYKADPTPHNREVMTLSFEYARMLNKRIRLQHELARKQSEDRINRGR